MVDPATVLWLYWGMYVTFVVVFVPLGLWLGHLVAKRYRNRRRKRRP